MTYFTVQYHTSTVLLSSVCESKLTGIDSREVTSAIQTN